MSWLADIAGKAEDFLNKIDQNAAVALSTIEERTHSRKNSRTIKVTDEFASQQKESVNVAQNSCKDQSASALARKENGRSKENGSNYQAGTPKASSGSSWDWDDTGEYDSLPHSKSISSPTAVNGSMKLNSTTNDNESGKRKTKKSEDKNRIVETITETASQNGAKAVTNGEDSGRPSATAKQSDVELLSFLNSREQRGIDELSLLKNEIATQAREMTLVLRNNKKLQADNEQLRKEIAELQTKLIVLQKQNTSSDSDIIRLELEKLQRDLKEKDDEIKSLQGRLDHAVSRLKDIGEVNRIENRMQQLELENRQLLTKQKEHENKLQHYETSAQHLQAQIQSLRDSLAKAEKEHDEYKEKAKSILRGKDELIASLKDGRSTGLSESGSSSESEVLAEIGSLRNERELLNGEISQSRVMYETCKEENRRLESEIQKLRASVRDLQDSCTRERHAAHAIEEESLQVSQNLSAVTLELEKERSERRKLEDQVQKLTSEKSARLPIQVEDFRTSSGLTGTPARYSPSYDTPDNSENLKTRVKALTQSLLEKQGLINNISADKQLLQIRVERLEQQLKAVAASTGESSNSGFTHAVISNQPLYLSESPWDSSVTLKMKRAYSRLDSLCCQLGLAMRHRPTLRLGFAAYIACLHLWVFFILFYWSHSSPLPPVT